jgi:hypothetical protein
MPTAKESTIPVIRLRELFEYDPSTGALVWRTRPESDFKTRSAWLWVNRRCAGKPVGAVIPNGYLQTYVNGKMFMVHRIVWAMHYGSWPEHHIDHVNHVRGDNRVSNLRDVTATGNARNASLYSTNTSGVTGVCKYRGGWVAFSRRGDVHVRIGYSTSFDKAVEMRKEYEKSNGFHDNHGAAPSGDYWCWSTEKRRREQSGP